MIITYFFVVESLKKYDIISIREILLYGGRCSMIQPSDIRATSFKKGLFGYKAADVDSYVSTVANAYEEAFKENAKLKEENERLNKVIADNNLKIFELEKKLAGDDKKEEKADNKNAKKADAKKDDKKDSSATSKFFKQAEETTVIGDDDEVFVGEIEEARKPNKAMIGDGEEGEGDDFEFL